MRLPQSGGPPAGTVKPDVVSLDDDSSDDTSSDEDDSENDDEKTGEDGDKDDDGGKGEEGDTAHHSVSFSLQHKIKEFQKHVNKMQKKDHTHYAAT